MRKLFVLTALLAFVFLPSATKAEGRAQAAPRAVKPVLKCTVASVKLIGTSVLATGGCKIGTKPAPAKWFWIQKAADLSGSPCQFGSGKGTSKRSNLLAYPTSVSRISGSALPGLLDVTFTVTARWGKQVAKASKSFHKRTSESRVMCGAPPKLVSLDGPEPSVLTWATPPSFDGTVFRVGTIQSRGNGTCKWQLDQKSPDQQRGFIFYGLGSFKCSNGYFGGTTLQLNLGLGPDSNGQGGWGCYATFDYVTNLVIPFDWGGYAWWQVFLMTGIPHGMPDGSSKSIGRVSPPAGPHSTWQPLPGLRGANQNPCQLPGMIPADTP